MNQQHSQAALAIRDDGANDSAPATARILLVDDVLDNRVILRRRFQRRGFEVVEADCGQEALRLVGEQTFDVVLLDIMMPDLEGTEVLRRIRESFSASQLPVIMVTAKSQSEDVVELLKLGANDYVTKPVDFLVALARVETQVARHRDELELRKANEILLNSQSQLESRISERSAKLVEANAVIQQEISKRAATEDQFAYLARHDALTGIPNRYTFDEKLNEMRKAARASGSHVSVLFIDLDGFKNINDTLGHAVGDFLLREVAALLVKTIGPRDFCARLGGDEFVIVQPSDDAHAEAAALAQKAIDAIKGCRFVDGSQIYIGASVGISVIDEGDSETATSLKQADLAMYRAKAQGRGVYRFFEAEMGQQAELRRSLELDMRAAAENGDFQLYYQPIVDLKERTVVGMEALMRWNHATRGFVPPIEFIALAEETGLIMQLGEWALDCACRDAALWPNRMQVAVNLSPVQFRNTELINVVKSALEKSGLAPERLELEITESVLLGNNAHNLHILNSLRELGVQISLDDFGTGYSGLSYLSAFHFDKVKIDQSFVRDMSTQPSSRAIIRAAVGISANLGICTTAEGVENLDQLESLIVEGCTQVQGYLFSRPMPNESIDGIIRRIELGSNAPLGET